MHEIVEATVWIYWCCRLSLPLLRYRDQCGEALVAWVQSPAAVVQSMLLDDGCPERGHRANLLNMDFRYVRPRSARHSQDEDRHATYDFSTTCTESEYPNHSSRKSFFLAKCLPSWPPSEINFEK